MARYRSRLIETCTRIALIAVGVPASAAILAGPACAADVRPTPVRAEWPQWRGPARDGVSAETGLAHEWRRPPRLVWQARGLGEGYSSISQAGGRIYTMGDRGPSQFVIALRATDGAELWATPIGASWQGGGYAGPRCTPTIDGENLYAIGPHGDLACLDAATGQIRWQKSLARDFGGKMMSHWGYSESPLVDGDRLICTPGGSQAAIVALDSARAPKYGGPACRV